MNSEQYFTRLASIPAIFNNDSILEFNIEPDKRFLLLGKSYIEFYVELPEDFVPDNNFGQKLFEYIDLNIQYEDASFKCSANDNDLTSNLTDLIFRDPAYLRKIKFEGHWDELSLDSSELKSLTDVIKDRRGQQFKKQILVDNKLVEKTFYRYQFMLPINHGLCRDNQLLPPGIHVRISCHRASPEKALVDISDEVISYPDKTIKIFNPSLNSCWAFSKDLDLKYDQIRNTGVKIPFESSCIRHKVLDDGLNEHSVMIMHGQMPKLIVFFLMEPLRFSNSLKYSSSKLEMHDLREFSLIMDNEIMQNYPLKVQNHANTLFYHQFYRRWLKMTGQYNSHEDMLTEENFIKDHFMIVETFEDAEQKNGILSVKVKFAEDLRQKLYLCWMPVTEKMLHFDRNLSVTISTE